MSPTANAGRRPRGVELCRVVLGIAAHGAIGRHVGDDQPDRPVALGLQGEDAVIFERAGEQHGKGDRLAEHRRDRLGIGVLRQDPVDRRAEPHQAAAQRERVDLKRLDQIVGRGAAGELKSGRSGAAASGDRTPVATR